MVPVYLSICYVEFPIDPEREIENDRILLYEQHVDLAVPDGHLRNAVFSSTI
jgi:hypothetical protein